MKQLVNTSDKEWTIPGVQGCFYPGAGKPIGTGPGEVPQATADRFALYPGWAVKEMADQSGAQGINASKGALNAAEAAGLDLAAISISGTGKDGQITKGDVDAYVAAQKDPE